MLGRLSTMQITAVLGGTALAAAVSFVPSGPAGAAVQTFDACPSAISTWVDSGTYPPFPTPSTEDASALVGCTGSFTPQTAESSTNVVAQFAFAGLPTDPCNVVTGITVGTSGTPGTGGWPFLAFDIGAATPITGPAGTGDGGYQQFNGAAGSLLPYNGLEVFSAAAQPSQGSYAVEYELDPTQITLADLAAGQLGLTVNVINDPGDVIESIRASVTIDDSACVPVTTTTTTSTSTSTTSTTLPTTTTTTPPAVVAVVATPKFTG